MPVVLGRQYRGLRVWTPQPACVRHQVALAMVLSLFLSRVGVVMVPVS